MKGITFMCIPFVGLGKKSVANIVGYKQLIRALPGTDLM